jgi:hypothetical protein
MSSSKRSQVGVGHIPVSADRRAIDVDIRDGVRPENALRSRPDALENRSGCFVRLPDAEEEAKQSSFHHGTEGEGRGRSKPSIGSPVVLMLGHRQGDEDVGVEEIGICHSSSNKAATSADVIGLPIDRTGRPDRSLTLRVTGSLS